MKNENFDAMFITDIVLKRESIESFRKYPFSIPAVRRMDRIELCSPVTFIVGENGMGKSTIIEAIALSIGLNPEGGSRNFNFATYDTHSELYRYLKLIRTFNHPQDYYFLRAESFYNVATNVDEIYRGDDPRKIEMTYGGSLHEKSHGESFFALLKNRLSGGGLYIFDEPEAALSPVRQMSMLTIINDLVRSGSQFIIATHSPILMAYPHAVIYELTDEGMIKTSYEETSNYNVTRDFLNNKERYLDILLE